MNILICILCVFLKVIFMLFFVLFCKFAPNVYTLSVVNVRHIMSFSALLCQGISTFTPLHTFRTINIALNENIIFVLQDLFKDSIGSVR